MQNTPYTLTELIQLDEFIAWVLRPDEISNAKWQKYLEQFPNNTLVVDNAKGYVILLAEDTGRHKPTPAQSEKMWKQVESQIKKKSEVDDTPRIDNTETREVPLWRKWVLAASVTFLLGVGVLSVWFYSNKLDTLEIAENNSSEIISVSNLVEKKNNTSKQMTVLLDDGSSVVLYPNARLSYSTVVSRNKREVSLVGKAFFEIVKDPSKPFYVYTDGIVTKVLGTSFLIDAREEVEEINVEVKTGKVSVFPNNKSKNKDEIPTYIPDNEGFVLTQDQKIVISRLSGKPVSIPMGIIKPIIEDDIANKSFVFDETPVSEVFTALEKAYNVNIKYNQSLMGDCPLNATLNGQPFNKKLSVICSALGAKYEIHENEVEITGNGCE